MDMWRPVKQVTPNFGLSLPTFAKRRFVEADQSDLPCPVAFAKIFPFSLDPNQNYIPRRPVPQRGARAIVTDAGRDAVDIDGAEDDRRLRWTAKSCGPGAPTLESSRWRQLRRRRWQKSPVTGESTKETVKTIACGNAGRSRRTSR